MMFIVKYIIYSFVGMESNYSELPAFSRHLHKVIIIYDKL